jgi:hypothetical protein
MGLKWKYPQCFRGDQISPVGQHGSIAKWGTAIMAFTIACQKIHLTGKTYVSKDPLLGKASAQTT